MTERGRLDYLDLEFPRNIRGGTTDHVNLVCFHDNKKDFKHTYHTAGNQHNSLSSVFAQLNCISDISYTILYNLQSEKDNNSSVFKSLLNLYQKQKEKISLIESSLQGLEPLSRKITFCKTAIKELTDKVDSLIFKSDKSYLSKLPTKKDIEDLLIRIDQKPRKIEQETVQLAKELEKRVQTLESLIQRVDIKISTFLA